MKSESAVPDAAEAKDENAVEEKEKEKQEEQAGNFDNINPDKSPNKEGKLGKNQPWKN